MHLNRRSKSKLQETRFSNLKTVEVGRGRNGYGFTMTGQHPCILSCILPGSPSDVCGLKAGDCVMAINGENVTRIGHEQIIKLIGSTSGVLRLTVAEVQESESSDEEDFVPAPRIRYMRSKSLTPSGKSKNNLSRDDQQTIMYKQHTLQSNAGANVASKFAPGHLSPYNQSGRAAVMLKKSANNYDYTYWNGKEFEQIRGAQKPRNVKRNSENKHLRRRAYSALSHSSHYPEEEEEDEGELADPGLRPLTPVEVSNIMYPSLRSQPRSGAQHRRLSASSEEQGVLMHAVVGYLGSIDIPASANLPMASLQAIRGCVRRLHLEQRIHSLMLMEITNKGVSLINVNHKVAVVYPAERITFSGICPDDKRCFGIVTSQNPEENLESADSDDEPIGSSCHVFIVDPSLCLHSGHLEMAARFNIQCIHDPSTNTCQQFPTSSRPLLTYIAQLHREHGDSLHFADFYGQSPYPVGPRRSNSNSSNSDSGFGNGKENEANGHGERVMIVDVAAHIRNQRTGQGLHDASPNRHVVHAEINTSQSSYSISSASSPEHSPQNAFKNNPSAGRLTPRARPDPILKDLNGRLTPHSRPPSVALNTASGRLTPRARPDPIGFHSSQVLVVSNKEQQQTMFKERSQSVDIMIQPQYQPPNMNNTIQNLRSHVREDDQVQVQKRQVTSTSVKGRPPTGRHSMYAKMDTGRKNSALMNQLAAEVEVKKKMHDLQRIGAPVKPLQNLYLARRNSDCSEYSSSDIIKTSMHKALQAKKVLLMQARGREALAASDGELDSPEADLSVKSDGNRSNPNLLQISDGQEVGRVSSWAVSFERLLQDELGLDCFTKFLKREFSEENIMFWIACETMSKMTSKAELKRMADHIYSKHLADEASMPVNLDSSCRLKVVQALKSPTPEMFKVQQQQIFKLMKYDSYSRFLKSKVYQDCLLAEMAGNPLPISISRERSDATSTGSVSSVDDTSEDSKKGAQQSQKGNKKKVRQSMGAEDCFPS